MASEAAILRDLLITTKDGDWGKGEPQDGYAPYWVIRGADFPGARVGDMSRVPLRYLDAKTVARRTLEPNDILIETAGGTRDRPTGRTLLVSAQLLARLDGPVTCASFARFLRIDPKEADPRYVFWYLQYLYAIGHMARHQVQHTGVARFQYTRFAETQQIPLPPRARQEAIAEVLGALDDKIANCALIAASSDAMFHVEWECRFGQLQTKPSHRLSELCSTQYGYTASAATEPCGPKFLRVMDINKANWIDWNSVPYCVADESVRARYGLRRGELVVARMADPGKAALVEADVEAVFASYLVRLVAHQPDDALFLFGFLKSRTYKDYAASHASGSVQKNMNAKVIVGTPLTLPSRSEIASFNTWASPIRGVITAALTESAALVRMRDTLLSRLLSGELRVQDAETVVEEAV